MTPIDKLISDACLIVVRPVETDGGIGQLDPAADKYAVGRFEIPWKEFRAVWQCMYRLIGEYGYRCGAAVCLSSGIRTVRRNSPGEVDREYLYSGDGPVDGRDEWGVLRPYVQEYFFGAAFPRIGLRENRMVCAGS